MPNIITSKVLEDFLELAPELEKNVQNHKEKLVLEPNQQSPFEYLMRAIIYQQLSGKAAATIHGRFLDLVGKLTPQNILTYSQEELRAVGLSRQKSGYVRNVAQAFQDEMQHYKSHRDLESQANEEIIKEFSAIKGVGTWTVEMYLIFGLGRLDVFSAKDLGVRKGVQLLYNTTNQPTPREAKELTKHWSPYSTVGTLLCWRIQD